MVGRYMCRLLAHMDRHGYDTVVPVVDDLAGERRPMVELRSGYVQRSIHQFPKQGSRGPWTIDYTADRLRLLEAPIDDPALRFARTATARLRVAA